MDICRLVILFGAAFLIGPAERGHTFGWLVTRLLHMVWRLLVLVLLAAGRVGAGQLGQGTESGPRRFKFLGDAF